MYGEPLASDYPSALAFAKAFGIPTLIRYQMKIQAQIDSGRSLNRQGVAAGKPIILVEIGQICSRDSGHVAIIVGGLRAGMQVLGMLPSSGHGTTLVQYQYYESTTSVPVRHSGIWHPVKTVGRTVVEGEQIGVIRDYSGAVVDKVTATASGFAVYGLAGPPVREGDSVMSIAIPTEAFAR